MSKKVHIINSLRDNVPEISLRFDISELDGAYIAEQIDNLNSDILRININSFGGLVKEAYSILASMAKFQANGGKIETINEGRADSSAGWIFAAGTRGMRKTMPYGKMFLHEPILADGTTIAEMPDGKEKQMLQKCFKDLVNIFVDTTGINNKTIEDLMKDSTELSADEMLNLGFADEKIKINNMPKLQNVSKQKFCEIANNHLKEINKMKKIAELLNLNSEASEEAINKSIQGIVNRNSELEQAVESLERKTEVLNSQNEELKQKYNGLKDAEVLNYVDEYIKLNPDKKEFKEAIINMAKVDFESFKGAYPLKETPVKVQNLNKQINNSSSDGNKDIEDAKKFFNMSLSEKDVLKDSDYSEYCRLSSLYETNFDKIIK